MHCRRNALRAIKKSPCFASPGWRRSSKRLSASAGRRGNNIRLRARNHDELERSCANTHPKASSESDGINRAEPAGAATASTAQSQLPNPAGSPADAHMEPEFIQGAPPPSFLLSPSLFRRKTPLPHTLSSDSNVIRSCCGRETVSPSEAHKDEVLNQMRQSTIPGCLFPSASKGHRAIPGSDCGPPNLL